MPTTAQTTRKTRLDMLRGSLRVLRAVQRSRAFYVEVGMHARAARAEVQIRGERENVRSDLDALRGRAAEALDHAAAASILIRTAGAMRTA